MSFHNVEAVRAVQRTRELQRRNDDKSIGEIFAKQVEQLFGKSLSFDAMQEAREQGVYDDALKAEENTPQDNTATQEDILVVRKPSQPLKTESPIKAPSKGNS